MRTLPLAVDFGATHVRVAAFACAPEGPRVTGIAVRPLDEDAMERGVLVEPDLVAEIVEDAVADLGTRERRAVACVGAPEAVVRPLALPAMNAYERQKAAQYESRRYVDFQPGESVVRLYPTRARGTYALGIAAKAAIKSRATCLRLAGLRPRAIDHESFALLRAFPNHRAVLDVGFRRSSLHVRMANGLPETYHLKTGGDVLTQGIASDLAIDRGSAERRKRLVGTAGAGEAARREFAADVVRLFEALPPGARASGVVMTGNGARTNGLLTDLATFTGSGIEMAASGALRGAAYPDDVVAARASDWNLVAGIALWGPP